MNNTLSYFRILFISLSCILSVTVSSQSVNFLSAQKAGGTEDDAGVGITVDGAGNTYTIGTFKLTVDFDPGPNNYPLTASGKEDIFITKRDAAGNFGWAKRIGGGDLDIPTDIILDKEGNLLITGYFYGQVDFNPDTGIYKMTGVNGDAFICKLDTAGTFIWAKRLGGAYSDRSHAIALDKYGNIYTTGFFSSTADFNPDLALTAYLVSSPSMHDAFVSKLDSAGNYIWAKKIAGIGYEEGNGIAVDDTGNVYTTGFMDAITDFNPNDTLTNYLTPADAYDTYICKFDSSGKFVWAMQQGGEDYDDGRGIRIDPTGYLYVIGRFRDTADLDPGPAVFPVITLAANATYISKFDLNGQFLWGKIVGAGNSWPLTMRVDQAGNSYSIGSFTGKTDFDPGADTLFITPKASDCFIWKLDANGSLLWVYTVSGQNDDVGNDVFVDAAGTVYATGFFRVTSDFNAGSGTFNLTSAGLNDIFTLKLSQCINSATTKVVMACNNYTWIDGNTYTANNNTATYTYTTNAGCDSIVTLNLTLNTVDTSVTVNFATITANATGANYQWLDCNNGNTPVNGAMSQNFAPLANGSYALAISQASCTDTSECINVTGVGLKEIRNGISLNLYPNPSTGNFTLRCEKTLQNVQVVVRNVWSSIILIKESYNTDVIAVDIEAQPGIYSIEVLADGVSLGTLKAVKQ